MAAKYFLVKVESDETTPNIVSELLGSLDNDNQYKHTHRAFVCDIRNPDIIARLDGADLMPSNVETIDRG